MALSTMPDFKRGAGRPVRARLDLVTSQAFGPKSKDATGAPMMEVVAWAAASSTVAGLDFQQRGNCLAQATIEAYEAATARLFAENPVLRQQFEFDLQRRFHNLLAEEKALGGLDA